MGEKLPNRCRNCGSTNLQTEPLYDDEEGLTDELALFCVSCGSYLGSMPSELFDRMRNLRQRLPSILPEAKGETNPDIALEAIQEFLLGRRAASPDFD